MIMGYKVTIRFQDGSTEDFGTYVSEFWARHHIALAHVYYEGNIYNSDKYRSAEWIITEE